MPEPGTKPPSPAKTVGQVATAAGSVALLLLWLVLEPPPAPYRAAIAIVAIGGIFTGGVVILVALVRHVEYRFTRRYGEAAAAQREHRQFVERHLAALVARQQALGEELSVISEAIRAIDERTQSNCEHIHATETQVARCMAEIGILTESVDELRETFVREGLRREP